MGYSSMASFSSGGPSRYHVLGNERATLAPAHPQSLQPICVGPTHSLPGLPIEGSPGDQRRGPGCQVGPGNSCCLEIVNAFSLLAPGSELFTNGQPEATGFCRSLNSVGQRFLGTNDPAEAEQRPGHAR